MSHRSISDLDAAARRDCFAPAHPPPVQYPLYPPVVNGEAFRRVMEARERGPHGLLHVGLGARRPEDAAAIALRQQLRARVRSGDTVGWLGAEGYVVLLVGTGAAKTATVAARLARVLDTPVTVLGIAPGERLEAALRRACVPFGDIARPAFAADD